MSTKRKTKEQFIKEARAVHGNKYDYSKVEYVNGTTKVCIICPEHGEFFQTPKQHIRGEGCPKCGYIKGKEKRKEKKVNHRKSRVRREHCFNTHHIPRNIKTTEDFINQARKIHGDKYDYSKVEYSGKKCFVTIICPEHGEFVQRADYHLQGKGCIKCGHIVSKRKQAYTTDEFIEILRKKFGDKYDYSKIDYINKKTKITLTCPIHGDFEKTPSSLLRYDCACPMCSLENKRKMFSMGTEKFIEKANDVFHGKYDYSKVDYKNNATKVRIICPEHGEFLCTPANHLKGRGCPICKIEHYVYEERLYNFLTTFINKEDIKRQYKEDWLTNGKSLDFFIPKYNLAIEHQGSQHYYLTRYAGDNEDKLNKRIKNDSDKYNECISNGVNILYFTYELKSKPKNCFHELIFEEEELKKIIKENYE